jgi:hypothetical protein
VFDQASSDGSLAGAAAIAIAEPTPLGEAALGAAAFTTGGRIEIEAFIDHDGASSDHVDT